MTPTQQKPKKIARSLDRERLKALVQASRSWQPYMRAEIGVKAPTRIETRLSCCGGATNR